MVTVGRARSAPPSSGSDLPEAASARAPLDRARILAAAIAPWAPIAIAAANATLARQSTVDLATGEQLLAAALVVSGSHELRAALADDTAKDSDRKGIVGAVFGQYTATARAILESLSTSRWSSEDDLVAGIEELGIRALAAAMVSGSPSTSVSFASTAIVTPPSSATVAISATATGASFAATTATVTVVK